MRKVAFLFILFLTAGMMVKAADAVTFKASAPGAVVMGQQFRLAYTVNAEARASDLRIPELADFEVLMGPSVSSSMSTQMINGHVSSETSVTFTYVLMPKKEGAFEIGAASIKVKGANYTSNALTIKVLPPDKAAEANEASGDGVSIGKDDYFVRMEVSNHNVYEQEGFLVTFKLYAARMCGLENAKFPEFEGFLAQEIELPQEKQWSQDHYNNRNYYTVVLKQTVLYPQRSGKLTIESGRFDAVIRIPSQRKIRSIFDEFTDTYNDVKKVLLSTPATIDVKALPSGKPESFSGAVGNFTMTSEINSNSVKTNDAVTVKVKITGNGNIKLIKKPEVVFPNDFDIFDPKEETDAKTTAAGVSGSKTIEYMAIPRYAGDFEIPAVKFSYFDPKSATYKTLQSEPYKLHVEQGEGESSSSPVVSNFSNKESVKYLGKDIRFLKVKNFHFIGSDIFFGSLTYYMCYIIPAILFVVFFFVYRKQVKENANIALVRTKKANKIAVKRLKNAGKLMNENKKEEFYEEVLRALWGYLSDKLNIPQANLTKDNVEAELTKYGVDENLISEFMDILNTCEFARYAPAQASDAMDKLYKLTVDAIGKMENTIKK